MKADIALQQSPACLHEGGWRMTTTYLLFNPQYIDVEQNCNMYAGSKVRNVSQFITIKHDGTGALNVISNQHVEKYNFFCIPLARN